MSTSPLQKLTEAYKTSFLDLLEKYSNDIIVEWLLDNQWTQGIYCTNTFTHCKTNKSFTLPDKNDVEYSDKIIDVYNVLMEHKYQL